jgi:hypothetical protein
MLSPLRSIKRTPEDVALRILNNGARNQSSAPLFFQLNAALPGRYACETADVREDGTQMPLVQRLQHVPEILQLRAA